MVVTESPMLCFWAVQQFTKRMKEIHMIPTLSASEEEDLLGQELSYPFPQWSGQGLCRCALFSQGSYWSLLMYTI